MMRRARRSRGRGERLPRAGAAATRHAITLIHGRSRPAHEQAERGHARDPRGVGRAGSEGPPDGLEVAAAVALRERWV